MKWTKLCVLYVSHEGNLSVELFYYHSFVVYSLKSSLWSTEAEKRPGKTAYIYILYTGIVNAEVANAFS